MELSVKTVYPDNWDKNNYPTNNAVTQSVACNWWDKFNKNLYDRLMAIKQSN